jgi:hypothetical protein
MPAAIKSKQQNLPNYKESDLERAFNLLIDAKEQLDAAKENLKQKKEAMLNEMDKADKTSITRDRYTISKNVKSMKVEIKIKEL